MIKLPFLLIEAAIATTKTFLNVYFQSGPLLDSEEHLCDKQSTIVIHVQSCADQMCATTIWNTLYTPSNVHVLYSIITLLCVAIVCIYIYIAIHT